jgi:hypothetical protein
MISTAGKKERKLISKKTWIIGLSISLKSNACAGEALTRMRDKNRVITIVVLNLKFEI